MKPTMSLASRSVSRRLASVEPDAGTLVVSAAKDGEVALDGDGGNSPFASAFVKDVPVPGLEVRRRFDIVRDDVLEMTNGQQKPFSCGSISGRQDFTLSRNEAVRPRRIAAPALSQLSGACGFDIKRREAIRCILQSCAA